MKVDIRRIDNTLPLPPYSTSGAVAVDIITRVTTVIQPNEIGLIPGNIVVKIPEGYAIFLFPRSSMPRKKGLTFPHSAGIVDQDFHGENDELMVQVMNISKEPVTVERGERIAQAVFVRIDKAEWNEVEGHGAQTRGGFGTTGTHA